MPRVFWKAFVTALFVRHKYISCDMTVGYGFVRLKQEGDKKEKREEDYIRGQSCVYGSWKHQDSILTEYLKCD